MKTNLDFTIKSLLACFILQSVLVSKAAPLPNAVDEIEVLRSTIKSDRKTVIADSLQLTEKESVKFWPLYNEYRDGMEKIGDGIVKLVLQYADEYPAVSEEAAAKMLKDYRALQEKQVKLQSKYWSKFGKVIPPPKSCGLRSWKLGWILLRACASPHRYPSRPYNQSCSSKSRLAEDEK